MATKESLRKRAKAENKKYQKEKRKVEGYDSKVETNVVDVYIRYLRNKIDRPGEKSYIQTVRGTGYVIRS